MAKHKTRRHARQKIPMLATAGIVAYAVNAYNGYKQAGVNGLSYNTIGVSEGKFHLDQFGRNVMAPAAGIAGSMLAAKFGANRYISKIPFFKF